MAQPGDEQASKSDTSGASESESEDKEEKDEMSASKKRRTRQKAHRRKAYATDQSPIVTHTGHNVPVAHRFCRKSPKEMRKNVGGMISKWKNNHYTV